MLSAVVLLTVALLAGAALGVTLHVYTREHSVASLDEQQLRTLTLPSGVSELGDVALQNGKHTRHIEGVRFITHLERFVRADVDTDGDQDAALLLITTAVDTSRPPELQPRVAVIVLVRNDGGIPHVADNTGVLETDAARLKVEKMTFTGVDVRQPQHEAAPASHHGPGGVQMAELDLTYRSASATHQIWDKRTHRVWRVHADTLFSTHHSPHNLPPPEDGTPLQRAARMERVHTARGVKRVTEIVTTLGAGGSVPIMGQKGQRITVRLRGHTSQQGVGIIRADGAEIIPPSPGRGSVEVTLEASGTYLAFITGSQRTQRIAVSIDSSQPNLYGDPLGVDTTQKILHLTFDDGPHPTYTRQLLTLLKEYDATATFFSLGARADKHPDVTREIRNSPHTLANHSYTHTNLKKKEHSFVSDELDRTRDALGDDDLRCFRPPYGAVDSKTRRWAAEKGYHTVLWDIDTEDWRKRGTRAIVQSVTTQAAPGAVVLMHDGGGDRRQTVEATRQILETLSQQGWTFRSIC